MTASKVLHPVGRGDVNVALVVNVDVNNGNFDMS